MNPLPPDFGFGGEFRRRLDRRHRFRLPLTWCPVQSSSWWIKPYDLVYPYQAIPPELSQWHVLRLVLVERKRKYRAGFWARRSRLPLHSAVAAQQAEAARRGLAPSVVTVQDFDTYSPYLALSEAQLDWLRCDDRYVVLKGGLAMGLIIAASEFERMKRALRTKIRTNHTQILPLMDGGSI